MRVLSSIELSVFMLNFRLKPIIGKGLHCSKNDTYKKWRLVKASRGDRRGDSCCRKAHGSNDAVFGLLCMIYFFNNNSPLYVLIYILEKTIYSSPLKSTKSRTITSVPIQYTIYERATTK